MKPEKIRELSLEGLRTRERELAEALFKLRFQKAIGQLEGAGKIRQTRRDIARVKTILKQKTAAAAKAAASEAKP